MGGGMNQTSQIQNNASDDCMIMLSFMQKYKSDIVGNFVDFLLERATDEALSNEPGTVGEAKSLMIYLCYKKFLEVGDVFFYSSIKGLRSCILGSWKWANR
eukprot:scaffold36943_cov61-Attheya_sp.AAC.3